MNNYKFRKFMLSSFFDINYYLNMYIDIEHKFLNPFIHLRYLYYFFTSLCTLMQLFQYKIKVNITKFTGTNWGGGG